MVGSYIPGSPCAQTGRGLQSCSVQWPQKQGKRRQFIPSLPRATTTSPHYKGPSKAARKRHTVYIVEFGCCGDLNHTEKVGEKAQQHAQLAARLQEAGWNVADGPHTIIPSAMRNPSKERPTTSCARLGARTARPACACHASTASRPSTRLPSSPNAAG